MKLTYKAIALMCGFEIYSVFSADTGHCSYWFDPKTKSKGSFLDTEYEAWEECCTSNGLVEE